jgi:hypothetical protein
MKSKYIKDVCFYDDGVNQIIDSLLGTFSQPYQQENWLVYWKEEFGEWCHSLIGISCVLAQSDPIKRCLHYFYVWSMGV